MKRSNHPILLSILCIGLVSFANQLTAEGESSKVSGDFRARLETANQEGRESSDALTLRSRVGLDSGDLNGFKFFIEAEDVRALDEDNYNPYPVAGKTVIADPAGTELNRAQVSYSGNGFIGILGRQRIILDGARFVGNVGWRQNEQTYDALTMKYVDSESGFTGFYGYIDEVQRIFGDDAPGSAMREFKSDSHLLNGSLKLENGIRIGGYAYLLDFSNAAANSTDTLGAYVSGVIANDESQQLTYYLEYATQSEAGPSPLDYSADYFHAVVESTFESFKVGAGYEILGSGNGVGFKTPLATLHKFNGWADGFLNTPDAGLEDLYLSVTKNVDGVNLTAVYHDYSANKGGTSFGHEMDVQAAVVVNKQLKLIAKAAFLEADGGIPDSDKFWVEADFSF